MKCEVFCLVEIQRQTTIVKKQKLNYHMVIHNGVPVKTVIWQIYDGTILV